MKNNAFNTGRLYAIYETIFEENGQRVEKFMECMYNPRPHICNFVDLTIGTNAYKKYEKELCEVYDEINEIPQYQNSEQKIEFIRGYYTQYNKMKRKPANKKSSPKLDLTEENFTDSR